MVSFAKLMHYVIYHADCPDGFGAAYAAWKCFGAEATSGAGG